MIVKRITKKEEIDMRFLGRNYNLINYDGKFCYSEIQQWIFFKINRAQNEDEALAAVKEMFVEIVAHNIVLLINRSKMMYVI